MKNLCLWLCMILCLVQYPTGSFPNNNSSINHLCGEEESQLLLQLKQQIPTLYPEEYHKTKYWKGSRDCCLWGGVTCDYYTGHVIGLDLSSSFLTGKLNSNSSLFHLTHLRGLNLAFNNFTGSAIPSEFAGLKALTHLNLSHARFDGEIPMEFYHLSNLLSLHLSTNDMFDVYEYNIRCDVKMLLGNMTRLRVLVLTNQFLNSEMPTNMSSFLTYLDLGFTGLRGQLPVTIFEKPNLQVLYLYSNSDIEASLPKSLNRSNVLSIMELELSSTSMSGELSDYVGLMRNLYYLALSHCRLRGPIPKSVGNITGIALMDLSENELSGAVPSTFSNLRNLFYLDLSHNHMGGQLPDELWGFHNLFYLHLTHNNLVGQIPSSLSLTNMSQLIHLDISSNALTGPFPSRPGHGLQKLRSIYLDNNSIQGMIPPWIFSLPSLKRLGLSSNRLTGRIGKLNSGILELCLSYNRFNIELESFYNLTYIEYLIISYNTVIERDGDITNVTFPNLRSLEMSSCDIKELPHNFLRSMPNLESLDLSNNSIRGPIPSWLTSNPLQPLSHLNLSFNFLTYMGDLPWQGLEILDLHSNSLRGKFHSSICNMSQLYILNLSHNKLRGHIPECLGNSSTRLEVIDLRRNEFHGNFLEGSLPPSLANCTRLEVIDLGNNMIKDTFPGWLHTLPYLRILILKSNSFHGSLPTPFTNNSFGSLQILDLSYNNFTGLLPEKLFASLQAIKNQSQASNVLYMEDVFSRYQYSVTLSMKGKVVELTKVLEIFNTIDLSSNHFSDDIPESISNLTSLRLLNLSHNNIHGSIPPALGRMNNLEQLDLSNNQLTGNILQSLTNLTFVGALNLSHNHLIGPIPLGNQFPTFTNESYAGNSGLCGAPLTRSCGNEREPPSEGDVEEEEDGFMLGFTWKVVVMGYGCGIVLGFILGNVMISIESQ